MSQEMNGGDWVVAVEEGSRRDEFRQLPVSVGTAPDADFRLDGLPGIIQIGRLGQTFFVQMGRGARNLRVGGVLVVSSQELRDGDVIAFDRARLRCLMTDGRLTLRVELLVPEGDTAPPDLEQVARIGSGEVAITPIAFKPPAVEASNVPKRRPRAASIGIGIAFSVLAVLAWFAFTAKSVEIQIDPAPNEVRLPSTLFKLKLGDRYLLRSGAHRVTAQLDGYYPLDTEIEVGVLADQTIDLQLTKLPGLITLETEPEVGARVTVDGAPLGITPLVDTELVPGVHRLEFAADRYLSEVRELEVQGGGVRESLRVSLTPNWAPVSITSDPSGATVLIDGAVAGTTPATVEMNAGQREVEVRLAGHNAWSDRVVVNANQPLSLPGIKLALADGRLEIASVPAEANVSLDGEFRGRTPLSLRLRPGKSHRLSLAKPGFETETRDVSVAADSGRRLLVELTPQYGEIEVVSTPPGANVFVDGEARGTAPTKLTLTALSHVIELRQTGFSSARIELTPRPGFPQRFDGRLEALDVSSGSGFAGTLRTSGGYELKLIPAGQFTMGSSRREVGRRSNELLRPVRLTRAFYLGSHEVTNAEFRAFKPDHNSGEFGGKSLNGDDQPAVNVSWSDAAQFLNALSIKEGLQPVYEERQGEWVPVRPLRNGYRLPTEAEWEWAARFAGRDAGLLYPWGSEIPPPDRSGNYADVSAAKLLPTTLVTYSDGYEVTAPVARFEPDRYGIYDLGGNVSEWVQDFYSIDVVETSERVDDPLGSEIGRFHVVRGASWRSATVTDLRVAARGYGAEPRDDIGFRIARNLQ